MIAGSFIQSKKAEFWLLSFFAIGVSALQIALLLQLSGLKPCQLCLLQRWPYYLGLPLSMLPLILPRKTVYLRLSRFIIGVLVFAFLSNALLAFYHMGLEWHWWSDNLLPCSVNAKLPDTTEDLLKQIQEYHPAPCSEAPWRLFGLSLAGYNLFASALLSFLAFLAFRATPAPESTPSCSGTINR